MRLDLRRIVSLLIALAGLLGVIALANPSFFTWQNISDVVLNATPVAVAALGMLLLIVIGQIDVSVGAILAACATAAGLMAIGGVPMPLIILGTMALGTLMGLANGSLVAGFGFHSIIVTLGALSIYRGLLILVTGGSWIYGLPKSFNALGQGTVAGIPNPVLIAVAVALLVAWMLRATAIGRDFFAVGSNIAAARLAGINVARVQLVAFALNGALVGLAAVIFASRFTVIQSNAGVGFEFAVITAVVVGGASIFGGTGTVLGTMLGAVLTGLASTVLVFLGVSALWEQALLGALVLAAVLLDRVHALSGRRVRWQRVPS